MELRLVGQAVGLFAVTNIDDLVILPVALIGLGAAILVEGGAFGL
jgi:hypothetical protein